MFGVFFAADMVGFGREMWRLVAPGGVLAVTTWGPDVFEPGNGEFWDAVNEERPDLNRGFNPWDDVTTPEGLTALLASGGVTEPRAEAVAGIQPLAEPAAFWDVVCGTGYRATIDALDVAARGRVRDRVVGRLRQRGVSEVATNVVYGTATKPAG